MYLNNTHRICCVHSAVAGTRIRHSVTSCVHCLSYFIYPRNFLDLLRLYSLCYKRFQNFSCLFLRLFLLCFFHWIISHSFLISCDAVWFSSLTTVRKQCRDVLVRPVVNKLSDLLRYIKVSVVIQLFGLHVLLFRCPKPSMLYYRLHLCWGYIIILQCTLVDFIQFSYNLSNLRRFHKTAKSDRYFLRVFCPSPGNNLAPIRRIFMKLEIWLFFENISRKFNFHKVW
jgi:hypothetical protein